MSLYVLEFFDSRASAKAEVCQCQTYKGRQCSGVLSKDHSAGANYAMFDLTWN